MDEDIPIGEDRFNVLNHQLVPHHSLVPEEDEASELSPWGLMEKGDNGEDRLAKDYCPKILITDPSVQALKEMEEADRADLPAGWLKNRVVKDFQIQQISWS